MHRHRYAVTRSIEIGIGVVAYHSIRRNRIITSGQQLPDLPPAHATGAPGERPTA
jgi:hypothetical protein